MSGTVSEVEIVAFQVGTKAARGITTAELDEAVASYNAATAPAPLVFGHPKSDEPAHGVIAKLRRDGNKLITALKDISADAVKGVRENRFINRSIAFWHPEHPSNPTPGKWNIRHLGLLGAASPGIPNMPKLSFSSDESMIEADQEPADALIFTKADGDQSAADELQRRVAQATFEGAVTALSTFAASLITTKEPPVADPNPGETVAKTEFDAAVAERDRLQGLVDAAAQQAKADREKANREYAANLGKEGKILPPHVPVISELFNRLPVEEIQFDADTKGTLESALRSMFDAAKPQIIFEAVSPKGGKEGGSMSAEQITAAAQKLVKDGKALNFEAAVAQIEKGA